MSAYENKTETRLVERFGSRSLVSPQIDLDLQLEWIRSSLLEQADRAQYKPIDTPFITTYDEPHTNETWAVASVKAIAVHDHQWSWVGIVQDEADLPTCTICGKQNWDALARE